MPYHPMPVLYSFAWAYSKLLLALWKRRNSILAADYDERAFHSIIIIQRARKRSRYKHVMDLLDDHEALAYLGCGPGKIVGALPNAIAMDIL